LKFSNYQILKLKEYCSIFRKFVQVFRNKESKKNNCNNTITKINFANNFKLKNQF